MVRKDIQWCSGWRSFFPSSLKVHDPCNAKFNQLRDLRGSKRVESAECGVLRFDTLPLKLFI